MTIETKFRTEDVPVAERFARWRENCCRWRTPLAIHSDHTPDFQATSRLLDLDTVQASALTYPSLEIRRTPKLIRRSDPELYQLLLNLRGTTAVAQADRDTVLGPEDLVLYNTSQPLHAKVTANMDTAAAVTVHIPRALLPLPPDKADRLLAVSFSGREGIGALLTRSILELTEHTDQYRPSDAARLTTITVDLLAALLAQRLDTESLLPPHTRQQAILARIHAFIRQQVHDPHLTPRAIAAAHHISLSYLHRLFQADGVTVSAVIRRQRLEHTRHDLANPALRTVPVHDIAARWGFTHPAAFSRAFRTTYGIPPTDYRHQTHQTLAVQPAIQAQASWRMQAVQNDGSRWPDSGPRMASVQPHTRSTATPKQGIVAGQDECAARNSNPESAGP